MRRKILIADRDESLQHAFSTIFSREHYEILYAANGKEVERFAEKVAPDVYIVNVNLPKINGIELYKKLQKEKFLDKATFFFLKDENDSTELLGYQAEGVIEKPVNFFRVYETITREDDVIELTDLVEEEKEIPKTRTREVPTADDLKTTVAAPGSRSRERDVEETTKPRTDIGDRLRHAMGTGVDEAVEETPIPPAVLEDHFKTAITQVMDEAGRQLAAQLAPVLAGYVEEYVKRTLLETAEKVIKEEIDKLLKESIT